MRLPSAAGYVPAVEKEQDVLPYLARRLDVAVPEPVALGEPGQGYPFPWSVRRWLDGVPAVQVDDLDHERFAAEVGAVLRQLRSVPATGGPTAGAHSFHRGEHPSVYDAEVRAALDTLGSGRPAAPSSTAARAKRSGPRPSPAGGTRRPSGSTVTSPRATCWSTTPGGCAR